MKMPLRLIAAALILIPLTAAAQPKKLKVFILAGQSNMEGHAKVETFDYVGLDPATKPMLDLMREENGKSAVAENVWISYLTGHHEGRANAEGTGKLTSGYGARGSRPTVDSGKIGPEFTFGLTMDAALEEPVLIIKTAWGGRSLHTSFRPPSAAPFEFSEAHIQYLKSRDRDVEAEKATKAEESGRFYRMMVDHVKSVLADPKRVCPAYDPAVGYEIAGFVWFQGWNDITDRNVYPDRDNPGGFDDYTVLLRHFIRDVRKDLNAPNMPFVIGVLGVGGILDLENPSRFTPTHHSFRQAMAAPAMEEEFKDNVVAVFTEKSWDPLQDQAAAKRDEVNNEIKKMERDGTQLSREEKAALTEKMLTEKLTEEERVALTGVSNFQFHYLGSAKILGGIGVQFAEALLPFVKN